LPCPTPCLLACRAACGGGRRQMGTARGYRMPRRRKTLWSGCAGLQDAESRGGARATSPEDVVLMKTASSPSTSLEPAHWPVKRRLARRRLPCRRMRHRRRPSPSRPDPSRAASPGAIPRCAASPGGSSRRSCLACARRPATTRDAARRLAHHLLAPPRLGSIGRKRNK
jgi:hypothetical protein